MSEEHGNLIKSPKQLIIMVFASFFVPLIIILLLMVFVNNGKRTDDAASAEQLIKPVAQLNFKDASAPRELQTGEQVYKAVCASCHASGAAGAPKFGDAAAWSARFRRCRILLHPVFPQLPAVRYTLPLRHLSHPAGDRDRGRHDLRKQGAGSLVISISMKP